MVAFILVCSALTHRSKYVVSQIENVEKFLHLAQQLWKQVQQEQFSICLQALKEAMKEQTELTNNLQLSRVVEDSDNLSLSSRNVSSLQQPQLQLLEPQTQTQKLENGQELVFQSFVEVQSPSQKSSITTKSLLQRKWKKFQENKKRSKEKYRMQKSKKRRRFSH